MKSFVILVVCAIIGIINANEEILDENTPILEEQVFVKDDYNQYAFHYRLEDGQSRTEQGALKMIDGNPVIVQRVSI